MPIDEVGIERLLQDIRRQIGRLEQIQDKQSDAQRAMDVSVARLEQVFADRAASCPWRVEIDEGLKTARSTRDGLVTLSGSVSEIKIKIATIAAGSGVAGGVAVEVGRALITALQGKAISGEASLLLGWLHGLFT